MSNETPAAETKPIRYVIVLERPRKPAWCRKLRIVLAWLFGIGSAMAIIRGETSAAAIDALIFLAFAWPWFPSPAPFILRARMIL